MQSPADFKKFINGIINEVSLRNKIKELQEYIALGLKTFAEIETFKRKKLFKTKSSKTLHQNSHRTLTNKSSSKKCYSINSNDLSISPTPQSKFSLDLPRQPPKRPMSPADLCLPLTKQSSQPLPNNSPKHQSINTREIDESQLLAPSECQLCKKLRIYPKAYLAIKETILREYALRGALRKSQAKRLLRIDVNKTSCIYNFFVEMGWIKLRPSSDSSTTRPPNKQSHHHSTLPSWASHNKKK